MRFIALLLLDIHLAFGAHSLQYFCTAVYGHINTPALTVVGMVDGQQFMYFDSNTNKAVPKTEWMRDYEGADYWEKDTQEVIDRYKEHQTLIKIIMDYCNLSISEDVHTFQMMYGCELDDDDGTTRGTLQYSYNGEDFISFDRNSPRWIPGEKHPQAIDIINQWDTDGAKTKYWKAYLESLCFNRIKNIVSYGKENLERKVAPEVSLLQKNSLSPVMCHATGFYPKNITMTWKKNNEDHYEDVEVSETLPNADGTFQKMLILSVTSEEWKKNPDVYRCVIQHVGAETEIIVTLNENKIRSNSASDNHIVKCVVSTTIAVAVGCVLVALIGYAVKKNSMCTGSAEVKSQISTVYMKGSATDPVLEFSDEPLQN